MTKAKENIDVATEKDLQKADETIKESFDYMVQLVSRKMEKKKPKKQDPDVVYQDYGVLEKGLEELKEIASDPAKYFADRYKDGVYAKVLEVSRLTGARFDRLLDSLMPLWAAYYSETSKEKRKKMIPAIEQLCDKIKRRATPGIFERATMFLTGRTKAKNIVKQERQK